MTSCEQTCSSACGKISLLSLDDLNENIYVEVIIPVSLWLVCVSGASNEYLVLERV